MIELIDKALITINIYQAVLFGILLFTAPDTKTKRILSIYMMIYAFSNIIFSLFIFNLSSINIYLFSIYHPFYSLAVVIFYFYIKKLSMIEKTSLFKDNKTFLHFIVPIIILLSNIVFYIPLSVKEKNDYLASIFYNHHIKIDPTIVSFLITYGYDIILSCQAFAYIYFLYKIKNKYHETIQNAFSFSERININWLKFVFLLFTLSFVLYLFFGNLQKFYIDINSRILFFSSQIIISFFIGFFGLRQRDILKEISSDNLHSSNPAEKQEYVVFGDIDVEILKDKLIRYIKENKPFLDPELRIDVLAKKLDTNRQYLSTTINKCFNLNFQQFINKYRVEEFLEVYKEPGYLNYDIESIAKEIGFKSKSTFYSSFRKFHSCTPLQYIKKNAQ